jgi:hypothetical protein
MTDNLTIENGGDNGRNRQAGEAVHEHTPKAGGGGTGAGITITVHPIEDDADEGACAFCGHTQQQGCICGVAVRIAPGRPGRGMVFIFPGSVPGGVAVVSDTHAPLPEHSGLQAGEITGHRCWRVEGDTLRSVSMSHRWPHDKPLEMEGDFQHSGGIYAYKTDCDLATKGRGYWEWVPECMVLGTVEMWGEIVEHENGYRAQYAQVSSLTGIVNGTGEQLQALRRAYGLPEGEKPELDIIRTRPLSHDYQLISSQVISSADFHDPHDRLKTVLGCVFWSLAALLGFIAYLVAAS